MAGTLEGIALTLMVMVGMVFVAVKTGEPAFWACVCVGCIALGTHAVIFVGKSRKERRGSLCMSDTHIGYVKKVQDGNVIVAYDGMEDEDDLVYHRLEQFVTGEPPEIGTKLRTEIVVYAGPVK